MPYTVIGLNRFVYWCAHIFFSIFFIESTVQVFNIDTVYSPNRHSTHEWIWFGSIVWCFLFIQSCTLSRSSIVCWVVCCANVIKTTAKFNHFDIYQIIYTKTNSSVHIFFTWISCFCSESDCFEERMKNSRKKNESKY